MSRRPSTLAPGYFADVYAGDPDPWRFASSAYERDKYAATLASLPRPRYGGALEIGCSIGVFTRELAGRCDDLLGIDVVPSVIEAAKAACAGLPQVRFARVAVPAEWPAGRFDLVVASEVAYYLDRADLGRLVDRIEHALLPGGDVILVHWLGETDYPLSGDEAAEAFIADASRFCDLHAGSRTDAYRLDVLRARTSGPMGFA